VEKLNQKRTIYFQRKLNGKGIEDSSGISDLYWIHDILVKLFNANTTGFRKFILQAGKNAVSRGDSQFSAPDQDSGGDKHQRLLEWLGVELHLENLTTESKVPCIYEKMWVWEAKSGDKLGNGKWLVWTGRRSGKTRDVGFVPQCNRRLRRSEKPIAWLEDFDSLFRVLNNIDSFTCSITTYREDVHMRLTTSDNVLFLAFFLSLKILEA
jgi:hypothetical protein